MKPIITTATLFLTLVLSLAILAACSESEPESPPAPTPPQTPAPVKTNAAPQDKPSETKAPVPKQPAFYRRSVRITRDGVPDRDVTINYRFYGDDKWQSPPSVIVMARGQKDVTVSCEIPHVDDAYNSQTHFVAIYAPGFEPRLINYSSLIEESPLTKLTPMVTEKVTPTLMAGVEHGEKVQVHVHAPVFSAETIKLHEDFVLGHGACAEGQSIGEDYMTSMQITSVPYSNLAHTLAIGESIEIPNIMMNTQVSFAAYGRGLGSAGLSFTTSATQTPRDLELRPVYNYEVVAMLRDKDGKTKPALGATLTYMIKGNAKSKTAPSAGDNKYYLFPDDWKQGVADEMVIEASWQAEDQSANFATKEPLRLEMVKAGAQVEVFLDELNTYVFALIENVSRIDQAPTTIYRARDYAFVIHANGKTYPHKTDRQGNFAFVVTRDVIGKYKIVFNQYTNRKISDEGRKSVESQEFDTGGEFYSPIHFKPR